MRQAWNADNNPGTPTLRMSILWRACHSGRGRRRHSQTLRSGLLSSPTIPAWLASSNHYPCARLGCTREALGYGNFCSSISSYIFHASSFCGAPVMHICARPINMTNYFCALASVSSRPRPLVANVICFRVLQLCFVYPPCLLHIFVSFLQFPLLGFHGCLHHLGCGLLVCLLPPDQMRSLVFSDLAPAMLSNSAQMAWPSHCVWRSLLPGPFHLCAAPMLVFSPYVPFFAPQIRFQALTLQDLLPVSAHLLRWSPMFAFDRLIFLPTSSNSAAPHCAPSCGSCAACPILSVVHVGATFIIGIRRLQDVSDPRSH